MLAKTRFLAGDVSRVIMASAMPDTHLRLPRQELTLIDLFHLPHGSFLKDQGFDFVTSESSRWPNVARYLSSIASRWESIGAETRS